MKTFKRSLIGLGLLIGILSITPALLRPEGIAASNNSGASIQVSGPSAETLVKDVRAAIERYPFADRYTMLPGPNSNSFTEWVAQEVPQLKLDLPMKAIGKFWMRQYYSTHLAASVP